MAYTRAADGVAQKGKTKGKNYGDDGQIVATMNGPKASLGGGKTNDNMMKLGRGLAKVASQKRG